MAVLRVNASRDGTLASPDADHASGRAWDAGLDVLATRLPADAPVTVMIHGYRYAPLARGLGRCHDPQRLLYRADPVRPVARRRPPEAAWAHGLGYSEHDPADGLALGFGWQAREDRLGALQGIDPAGFASVYRGAERAGAALAAAIRRLGAALPGRRIGIFAHSLGARVALAAASELPAGLLGRMVFLGAAEFAGIARERVPEAEVYNVISRRNDVYDMLFRTFAPRGAAQGSLPLGFAGLPEAGARWLDIQLDHEAVRGWMRRRGIALDPGPWRISHWNFYSDPGAMTLWRSILRDRTAAWSVESLRAAGLPGAIEPRWALMRPRVPWPRRGLAAGAEEAVQGQA